MSVVVSGRRSPRLQQVRPESTMELTEADVAALLAAAANVTAPTAPVVTADSEPGRVIAALELSIHHLQRSNAELEEFMRDNGHDKSLREAIGENIAIIARRKAQLEDLRKQAGITEPLTDLPATLSAPPVDAAASAPSAAASAGVAVAADVCESAASSDAPASSGLYL